MTVLKRIGVLSLAKVYGATGVIVGLILGIIIALIGTAALAFRGAAGLGVGFGIFSIVLLPIIYGIVMFILGAVSAFLYNFVAAKIGGVELELEQKK